MDGLPTHDDNGRQADIPDHVERLFNNITDNLLRINGHADIAYRDIARYQNIINNGNAQVQGLRDELANDRRTRQQLQTELVNAQREWDKARRNAHCWIVRYNDDTARLQAAYQRLQ